MTLENVYIKNLLHYTLLIRKLQVQPKRLTLTAALSSIISELTSTSLAFFCHYCKREDCTQVGGNMELGAVGVIYLNIYNGPINSNCA